MCVTSVLGKAIATVIVRFYEILFEVPFGWCWVLLGWGTQLHRAPRRLDCTLGEDVEIQSSEDT